MKTSDEVSTLGVVLQCLGKLWEPSGKAFEVQAKLGVSSLKETRGVVERAGYEICPVDLPAKVSGFAEIIADKPHIVLNRRKPLISRHYTVPHELGHHVLHLNRAGETDPLGFPDFGGAELEADLFATSWLLLLKDDKQRNDVLRSNPEPSRTLAIYFLLSIAIVLFGLLAHFTLRNVSESR